MWGDTPKGRCNCRDKFHFYHGRVVISLFSLGVDEGYDKPLEVMLLLRSSRHYGECLQRVAQ